MQNLGPADQQLVEIARALSQEHCRLLILDEPTSSLGAHDASRLFEVIASLRKQGLTILYISHFLEEVQRVADTFTILRDGRSVATGRVNNATVQELVAHMAGREVKQLFPRAHRSIDEDEKTLNDADVLLTVQELRGAVKPRSATLALRRGEVIGIAGLIGSGRTELLRTIFGLDRVVNGEVKVGAWSGSASPHRRLKQGVGLLSEDRKREGLATSLSLADNVTLSKLSFFTTPRKEEWIAKTFIKMLSIKCKGASQRVADLSGGNQQKVAIARLLHHDLDVFLLDEPTRGIDVGSKAQIYQLIDSLASKRKAILMVSSYLPELLGVCDRIAVMYRGVLGEARPVAAWNERSLLAEATGIRP
ncbi:MAG: hypothetical protein NVSMB1_25450 [Polyangiales bacterium]